MMPIEREENRAAIEIQRIARGRQARHYVERRRRKFNRAATKIQSRARGMRDRKRVTWAWKLHFASIGMQKIVRGRLDRVRVAAMRKFRKDTQYVFVVGVCLSVCAVCLSIYLSICLSVCLLTCSHARLPPRVPAVAMCATTMLHVRMPLVLHSLVRSAATLIQACMRGHVGRKRLRAKRFVRQFSRLANESADAMKPRVLEDLCALSQPPPAVVSVMQCALILLAPIEGLFTHAGHVFVDPTQAAAAKAKSALAAQHIDSDSDDSDGDTV